MNGWEERTPCCCCCFVVVFLSKAAGYKKGGLSIFGAVIRQKHILRLFQWINNCLLMRRSKLNLQECTPENTNTIFYEIMPAYPQCTAFYFLSNQVPTRPPSLRRWVQSRYTPPQWGARRQKAGFSQFEPILINNDICQQSDCTRYGSKVHPFREWRQSILLSTKRLRPTILNSESVP